jgi:uncharacterized LabA/DUF88 family protein
MANKERALAVLIDADNASPAIIDGLLAEIAGFGTASVKRIYGDWTKPNLGGWKAVLLEHSIQPIQQFGYTSGKNATDSAMIIDAMDLLYTGPFDGFCIVSSDSDFTRLAARLRESGKLVYGFGEMKTPKPFVAACDRFIYTEVFSADETTEAATTSAIKTQTAKDLRGNSKLMQAIRKGIATASDEAGWCYLGPLGLYMTKAIPEFDPRNYGYQKLSELMEAIGLFEVQKKGDLVYIRDKRKQDKV